MCLNIVHSASSLSDSSSRIDTPTPGAQLERCVSTSNTLLSMMNSCPSSQHAKKPLRPRIQIWPTSACSRVMRQFGGGQVRARQDSMAFFKLAKSFPGPQSNIRPFPLSECCSEGSLMPDPRSAEVIQQTTSRQLHDRSAQDSPLSPRLSLHSEDDASL